MQLNPGTRLGHYEIGTLLGRGGMGEVYRATDTRLGREVALKVLPPQFAEDPVRLARFQLEAKTLAALDHPGIVTVFSVEHDSGTHFLTMQLVPGQTLRETIPKEGLPADRIVDLGVLLSDAIAAAHEMEIVHRDIKPGNVMITPDGRVKVLDFGLAKSSDTVTFGPDDPTRERGITDDGHIVGTMPYMSPEQIEGGHLGPASDVFSLGVVLYEMASGRRPFHGDTAPRLMSSILAETPPPPSQVRRDVSRELDSLIVRSLSKSPAQRPRAKELRDALVSLRAKSTSPLRGVKPWMLAAVLLAVAIVIGAAWTAVSRSRKAAFVAEALPRIERLSNDAKFVEAFALAKEVEQRAGTESVPAALRDLYSVAARVETNPPAAAISFRPYGTNDAWTPLGRSPLKAARVPRGPLHWRAELPGHLTAQHVTTPSEEPVRLDLAKDQPDNRGMVRVPAALIDIWTIGTLRPNRRIELGAFQIDRGEVTNAEFARFVAAGGYSKPEYWKHPFRDGARTLTFAEAMERFRDATGRPGPASWRLGNHEDGAEELPVHGVSWYEAAAYAEFAGKELPTIYHWYEADTAGDLQLLPGMMAPGANYDSRGPRAATASTPVSAHGAVEMAGNVREWSASVMENGSVVVLGGAWSDPSYIYLIPQALDRFDRGIGNGFRCMRRVGSEPLPDAATATIPTRAAIDYAAMKPASDEMYEVFTRFHERSPVPVDGRIESVDESSKHWIKQKVSYAAGYGGERMFAWLYLPRSSRPPYQVILQMAGASTFFRSKSSAKESDIFGWLYAEYLIRGGRAVMIPIWKGSYERQDGFHPLESDRTAYREKVNAWVTELRQSMDYLETRKDIDSSAIGYQGISFGARWGPNFMALEPRLKTSILLLTGRQLSEPVGGPLSPEVDPYHYAPRVKTPVLMMGGRYDPLYPYETSQVPLFESLGTSPELKKHLTYPSGHSVQGWRDEMHREGLQWLDARLGPVK